MRVDNLDVFFNEYKSFARDFKMESFDVDTPLTTILPKKNIFSFLYKRGNRKIKELMDIGGVIVGSRALKFYYYNGYPIIDRKADDWDIVLDRDSFVKFCSKNKLYNMDYTKDVISINFKSGISVGRSAYSSEKDYIFKYDFDIISKDDIPNYIEVGNYRIAKLENILDEKIKLIKEEIKTMAPWANYESKHYLDCNEIMTKIKSYKNEKNLH